MSLYRITWDGQDILDYTDDRLVLLSPHYEGEINTAGSLRFIVPPEHRFYDIFTVNSMIVTDVELYENDDLIWFGRPIEFRKDFYNQKEIYCEGALGFFNDSIIEKHEFEGKIHEFFKSVLFDHNFQVSESRKILPGNITVDNKDVYRAPNYEKTLDVLRSQCLDTNDGYFFLRKENGSIYLDWLKDMPFECNQTIEFAENMLNVSNSFDGTDYATCVMPIGGAGENGEPVTIYDVNNSDNLIISPMAEVYGRIVTVVNFNDITDPYELMEEGQKALERIQYNSNLIECSAADLHSIDRSKEKFRVGQMVHCYSEPHGIDIDLPLSKIELELDTAVKNITLGIIPKKTLTRITRRNDLDSGNSYDWGSSGGSGFFDDDGIEWDIVTPDEPGGDITAYPMPTDIRVARNPNKTTYTPGEQLDFTGLVVNIWSNDKIWTKPPRYIDGTAPMSELTFSAHKAPNISEFGVDIMWAYKGQRFWTSIYMRTT